MPVTLDQPLDLHDPEADTFLEGIQGNILRSHGRDFSRHVILRLAGAPDAARRWIATFAAGQVTTAAEAGRQAAAWRGGDGPGELFTTFALSADGYRALGLGDRIPTPVDPFSPRLSPRYFPAGMKGQATIASRHANDPDVATWEAPYQGVVHAMVLLAHDDPGALTTAVAAVTSSAAGVFEVLTVEEGARLTREFPGRGDLTIEHFGFQDGVSQPLMIKQDAEAEIARRGATQWDPGAPLSLALAVEPGGGHGSFLVFRKLEQDVKAFREALEHLAGVTGADVDDVGAMAVGRRQDGTPLVPTTTADPADPTIDPNDFHYDQDPVGRQCPLHAHIRKTNPRGDVPRYIGAPTAFERARRIVRRGITYGERPDLAGPDGAELPSGGVGLLFQCFQSTLDQFMIQQDGSDSNHFVRRGVGVDPVIGQNPDPVPQTWFGPNGVPFTMANFVRMRGGEYFFAPSIAFLTGLDDEVTA